MFLISQLFLSPLQEKPFTPILGETFTCIIGDLILYQEEIVHKPPTSAIYGKSENYTIEGYLSTNASTGANTVKARKTGSLLIKFKDGNVHELYFPQIHIKGTTVGKRLFNFKHIVMVVDKDNNLASYVKINPDEKGALASFFSSKQKSYPDTIKGNIVNLNSVKINPNGKHTLEKNFKSYCKIDGEWTNHILFDDVKYWYYKNYDLINLCKPEFILPSDSLNRLDLNYLLRGDIDNAQKNKEEYEEIQRNDRKLRGEN